MRIAAADAASPLLGPAAIAARAGATQVTGEVAEAAESAIVLVKGKELLESERSPEIRATGAGAVKAGDEAAVRCRMTAASVEVIAAEKRKAR